MRESTDAKAVRMLAEGRLCVALIARDGTIEAAAEGDSGTYELGWTAERGWYCGCPASVECSHIKALHLVTELKVLDVEDERSGEGATGTVGS